MATGKGFEKRVGVPSGIQVDFGLDHLVVRVAGAKGGGGGLRMGQLGQEQGNADQGIPASVQRRVNDPAVAFSTDYGSHFLHGGYDVDLSDGTRRVGLSMSLGHITQGPGAAQVADHRAGGVGEDVVGDGHQCVFLTEHAAVLANQGEAVHVGVHGDAQVALVLDHSSGQGGEVLGPGLRIVREPAVRLAIEFNDLFNAEGPEQGRNSDAARAVNRVDGHLESRLGNGLAVDQLEVEDGLDVSVDPPAALLDGSQGFYRCEFRVGLRQPDHFRPVLG